MNYPMSFNKFYDAIIYKGRAKKTKGCLTVISKMSEGSICVSLDYGDGVIEFFRTYNVNDKEGLYCDMLDMYMFPRVKEATQ